MKVHSVYLVSVLVCFTLAIPLKETPKKQKTKVKFIPKFNPSTCKKGLEICNDTVTYPIKAIQRLVKKKKNLSLFSNVSLIEPADDTPVPKTREDLEPDNLCKTLPVTMVPKAGYDYHSGEQRFIVNIRDYVQTVSYETCVEPNKECINTDMFPFGFRTLCTQKYNIVRLVSLSNKGNVDYGKFMVPSTCVCSYFKESMSF